MIYKKLNMKKRGKIRHFLHSTLAYCTAQLNTRKILIYVLTLDTISIIYQYLFGIWMSSTCILAECWKLSEIAKIAYFCSCYLSPYKSPFNHYCPKSVTNPESLTIPLTKNDKMLMLAKISFFNENQLH